MNLKTKHLLFFLFFTKIVYSQDLSDLNSSVVKVVYSCRDIGKAKSGTGFVWKKSNQIVTALHLVTGNCSNGSINIFIPSNNTYTKGVFYSAKVVKILKSADLAMLEVNIPKLKPLNSISSNLFIKQNVEALGYPLGAPSKRSIQLRIPFNESKKLRPNLPSSIVAELNKLNFNPDIEVVHFQGSLLPGLSGAPIFNNKGQIIAIGNGGLNRGQVGISWGIPSSKILDLENSIENINNIDDSFRKSSEIAFSSELPIDMNSFGEDFLIKEKEILQKDMFKIQNIEFYKVAQKSFSDILKYSNDQNALTALINLFQKTNLTKTEFDIYRNFETGLTFVLPHDYKIIKKGNETEFITSHRSLHIKLNYYKLAKNYDIMDELCENGRLNRPIDSISSWQRSPNYSYPAPILTFDGQYINREGYGKNSFVNGSTNIQQLEFQFITTAKKNKDLFFLSLTDDEGSTEYNQNLSLCLQDDNNSMCEDVLTKWNEIAKLVFCQYLFSFST
ncbi:serine protease [Flavobacterium amniphilum]|uniref:S1 family peptidase n=1 Tax=Flavobacterium amniphilum TaxID=1834035 RepID=UPI00202A1EBC|nr:serine protease [Flavobacterium amniphilum]MCL9804454.1 serine protease [Flavobacterium amniphilum]